MGPKLLKTVCLLQLGQENSERTYFWGCIKIAWASIFLTLMKTVLLRAVSPQEKKDQLKLLLETGAAEQQMRGEAVFICVMISD